MWGFWGVLGGIVAAVVGAVIAAPLIPAIIVGVVGGVVLCATGLVCPTVNNDTVRGGNKNPSVIINQPSQNIRGGPSGGQSGGSGGAGGGAAQACSTSGTNACGMSGTGFITNGVCSATVPPNSACPVPTIGTNGFYAEPALVRSGEQTTLRWNVTNATTCSLSGGSLSLLGLPLSGNNLSGSITQKTTYTLTCENGDGGPSTSANTTVNLVPSFQEI
jgi:hypothetical protein